MIKDFLISLDGLLKVCAKSFFLGKGWTASEIGGDGDLLLFFLTTC